MKLSLRCCAVLTISCTASFGQTADNYVSQGRSFLASHNLTNANARFSSAIALSHYHTNANVFRAATRLLTLADQPAGKAFLDRLGFAKTNRSVYGWTAGLHRDTNGVPDAPVNMSAAELTAFLQTNVLREIVAAGTNLAVVTKTNYTLALASNETSTAAVTLDYGDILMLRAGLKLTEYLGYTIDSWNVDIQLAAIRALFTNQASTAEQFLAQYPSLFTFANPANLQAARQAFTNAVTLYLNGSAFIRSRPANVTRLFNFDSGGTQQEADFRTTITELNQSLSGPVVLTLSTNLTMDLANHFSADHPLRGFFPEFSDDAIVTGTLPDPTLGGLVHGLQPYEIEDFLGHRKHPSGRSFGLGIPFASWFAVPQRLADGGYQIALKALENSFFIIQVSTDLETWTDLTDGVVHQGLLWFADTNVAGLENRYYRALDASKSVSIKGTVFDAATGDPVPDATVGFSFPSGTAPSVINRTDNLGRFFILGEASDAYDYRIQITAPGYAGLDFSDYLPPAAHLAQSFYLAPFGYNPPNDNFDQRQAIVGVNVTVQGQNAGATIEPFEPRHANAGRSNSVWWTWKAEADGAITIDTVGSAFPTVLAVYVGDDVSNLIPVASDDAYDSAIGATVNFFVQAGTAYQIAAASYFNNPGGPIVLQLRSTAPLVPTITSQPQSRTIMENGSAYLEVYAVGTIPLSYQWRLNGVELPGATDASYQIYNAQTNQSGAYSVVVSNGAGSITSTDAILTVRPIPPPPPNDLFAKRIAISGSSAVVQGYNFGATKEPGEPNLYGNAGGKSVWWKWTAPKTGTVTISTIGSDFDTLLGVFKGTSVAALTLVASDDESGGNSTSKVVFSATTGTAYQIAVDGYNGASGYVTLNVSQP